MIAPANHASQPASFEVRVLRQDAPGESSYWERHRITYEPMSKFPVVRDLVVDRGRMFRALERVHAWIPVDGYGDRGPGPHESQQGQEVRYPLSECMTCGCCVEACPQFTKVELAQHSGESDEEFAERKDKAHGEAFVVGAAISQAMLFNDHPTGHMNAGERLEALMGRWGGR